MLLHFENRVYVFLSAREMITLHPSHFSFVLKQSNEKKPQPQQQKELNEKKKTERERDTNICI